ncbi:MAG: HpcH/HpaI aldolase/citrate lyase family protein [Alkalilacustris sp.]
MLTGSTFLFVPGTRPDRFDKAIGSGACGAIIDLEDAVDPADKAQARAILGAASPDWSRVVVRMNAAGSPWFAEDLAVLSTLPVRAILLPKCEGPDQVEAVGAKVAHDRSAPPAIIPQIETARGVHALDRILACPSVPRVAFGHLDYAVDLGCDPEWEPMLAARAQIVFASRLAGKDRPIDSVTPDIADEARLVAEATAARRLGFGGKLLVHPAQVAPARRAFDPSPEDIAWARRVVAAGRASTGAVRLDGQMIDRPVVNRARRLLAAAAADPSAPPRS